MAGTRRGAGAHAHQQCSIFTGIGPAAESNRVTLRIKYGKIPKKTGISPDPAAESKVGYIPPFYGTQLWLRLPARVRLWPSTGAGRGQYAGSALLRNEAVHSVLPGPRAVSCLVFVRAKRATDSSTTHAGPTSRRLLASWITSQLDFIDLNHSYPLSMAHGMHSFVAKRPVSS